jgi:hypothetical protein
MAIEFEITSGGQPDGSLVLFGNLDPKNDRKLQIPATFERRVKYVSQQLELELHCVFTGDRIEISRMVISGLGKFVGSRDLTQLSLPQVIRKIAFDVIPNSHEWTEETRSKDIEWGNLNAGDGFLAQLYWFEHVSWGAPRSALMSYLGCSRTTANAHIRRIAKQFDLPGVHAQQEK